MPCWSKWMFCPNKDVHTSHVIYLNYDNSGAISLHCKLVVGAQHNYALRTKCHRALALIMNHPRVVISSPVGIFSLLEIFSQAFSTFIPC